MNLERPTSNVEHRYEEARAAHMENLYGWICRQRDEAAAVAALENYALRDLLGWLARLNVLSGIPGRIYGLCLVESSQRFQNS